MGLVVAYRLQRLVNFLHKKGMQNRYTCEIKDK